ncbi:hypothetical protein GEU84_010995 [Fertoebacter nigrum]|uniref:Flagellar protein FlgN n=1 Tax=Fertoeibacter niger TaxID=2656921 RepID=A0A8X8GV54_9RHOB|nr:hypothetical protein [Fertoeibacter niger]NUB44913.1 hypothetical protein [Fertoeibacter niger]
MSADLTALDDLLDRMLGCILLSDLAALSPLAAEAETLLARVTTPADIVAVHRLRAKAEHNARCLAATARGLRAAQRRLAEIRALREGRTRLVTYDGQGRRAETALSPASLTRRI